MSLDYAILSFLNFAPMSGYDLKKLFDDSINHFWSATQSHIYRALGQMETRGWITHETIDQERHPNKKVYSITPAEPGTFTPGSHPPFHWMNYWKPG